jgi:hypothetical protein
VSYRYIDRIGNLRGSARNAERRRITRIERYRQCSYIQPMICSSDPNPPFAIFKIEILSSTRAYVCAQQSDRIDLIDIFHKQGSRFVLALYSITSCRQPKSRSAVNDDIRGLSRRFLHSIAESSPLPLNIPRSTTLMKSDNRQYPLLEDCGSCFI